MLAHDYATAVAKQLESGEKPETVFASLDRVLVRKGHEKLRARILALLATKMDGREASGTALILKEASDEKKLRGEIEKAEKELAVKESAQTVIDPTIVGGFILKTKEKQIDRSYKRALINLYRRITTN